MSEEEYLAHLVKLIIQLEEECDTPSIGVQLKHLLNDSIIAERNTDFLSVHKFINQYDMALMEDATDGEFDLITKTLFSQDELAAMMDGGVEE